MHFVKCFQNNYFISCYYYKTTFQQQECCVTTTHAHIHTHDCVCSFNLPLQRGMGSDPWFHWRQSTAGCILSSPTTLFPPSILSSFPHSSSPPSTLVSPCPKCFLCPMIFDLWPWPSVWNSVCPPVVKPVWINEFRSQKLTAGNTLRTFVSLCGFQRFWQASSQKTDLGHIFTSRLLSLVCTRMVSVGGKKWK